MTAAAWPDKLEKHFGEFAIPHITRGLVAFSALTFVLNLLSPGFADVLILNPAAIMRGEVWRLVTFILLPGGISPISVLLYPIMLMATWFIGESLEEEWGAFRLNLYILIGMISLIIATFLIIRTPVSNAVLLYSIFFAFATTFPRHKFVIFPLPIPIQVRYLAILLAILLTLEMLTPGYRTFIVASLVNYVLYYFQPFLALLTKRSK